MLFLDLNMRKKVHQMDYKTENLVISCENLLDKSYTEYSRMFEVAIGSIEIAENLLINVELQTSDKLTESDIVQFHQCLVGCLARRILTNEKRDAEPRLTVDAGLAYVHPVILRKLINQKTLINCFNLVVRYGNHIMDTTGGYYVSAEIQK